MSAWLLALALTLPARGAASRDEEAAAQAAAAPALKDEDLMDEFNVKAAYSALQELRPRIDALVRELTALRDTHAGRTEPDPGGPRRLEARNELKGLRIELYNRGRALDSLGNSQRVSKVFLMALQYKKGKGADAYKTFQGGYRHAQIVRDSKDFARTLEVLLDEEERAHAEAVGRWRVLEEARRFRRRAASAGAAVVLLAAGALLWRRRRAPAPSAGGESLGRWRLANPPRPWAYGTRWDDADGGSGSRASLRLVDPRLGASPTRLLAALRAAAPAKLRGVSAPLEAFPVGASVALAYPSTPSRPLAKWLDQGRGVPPAQAVKFLKRLAPALDAAHRAGKTHGGLEPGCVLVGGDGSVVLEDFGVAVALAAAGVPTPASPAYSAPELASGPPSAAADLYSLGVMLYELVTGRHPFEGTNLLAMKREKRYAPLSRAVPGCPPAMDALVDGLLEPEPARRRPAPGGLKDALRALG